jgi:uncharacterized protein YjbJ (UPF0337 family)
MSGSDGGKGKSKGKGLFDKAKDLVGGLKDKATDLADDHQDQIDGAIDKAAVQADKRTGGKHADKIAKARKAAHGAVDKLADDNDEKPDRPAR